ncbi:hypothetical protein Golomagni_05277 [Golovinomyces magnicellulatus]|nr:hypothetical protein Golomagni_05277 [Golovinomyces magnicellulatus]
MSRFAARDGTKETFHPIAISILMYICAGITSLWAGLSASILRQGTYSTARFGLHSSISSAVLTKSGRDSLPFTWNVACAGVAGGIAGLVGNPTEVILVRMCADGAKNTSDRFVYSNAIQGLMRIGREEGIGAFTKGLAPNIVRSVFMNVAQIATYSSAKGYILKSIRQKDDIATHALASLAAGTVATTVCAPADVLKSRMQSSAGGDVSNRNESCVENQPTNTSLVGPESNHSSGSQRRRTKIPHEGLDTSLVTPNTAYCTYIRLYGAAAQSDAVFLLVTYYTTCQIVDQIKCNNSS